MWEIRQDPKQIRSWLGYGGRDLWKEYSKNYNVLYKTKKSSPFVMILPYKKLAEFVRKAKKIDGWTKKGFTFYKLKKQIIKQTEIHYHIFHEAEELGKKIPVLNFKIHFGTSPVFDETAYDDDAGWKVEADYKKFLNLLPIRWEEPPSENFSEKEHKWYFKQTTKTRRVVYLRDRESTLG